MIDKVKNLTTRDTKWFMFLTLHISFMQLNRPPSVGTMKKYCRVLVKHLAKKQVSKIQLEITGPNLTFLIASRNEV
jgi:hypothetical protein